jgi:short-subunit dehydrogenase
VAQYGIAVSTLTPGFIRTDISVHALKGDGSSFNRVDANIAGGMDATRCARIILRGLRKRKPEIAVGQGVEMHALWLKRLFPRLLFKVVEKMARSGRA